MKRLGRFWLAAISVLLLSGMIAAQEPDFQFSFGDFPSRVTGTTLDVNGTVFLATSNNPTAGMDPERGAQGWQLSIGVEGGGVVVTGINLNGTDAFDLLNTPVPPDIDPFSVVRFVRSEVVDPEEVANPDGNALGGESEIPVGEPQGPGAVSAVALPFAEGFSVEAPVDGPISVANLTTECTAPEGEGVCEDVRFFFIDGKKGGGQPVKNTVTFTGDSISPTREETTVQCCSPGASVIGPFVRGDCNGSGALEGTSDAIKVLMYNFIDPTPPDCLAACDANGDGIVIGGVGDAIYIVQTAFGDGPPPPAPFPDAAISEEPGDEALGCDTPLQ